MLFSARIKKDEILENMKQYDTCVVSFSDLNFDARSINLIKTCARINLKVLAVSVRYESQKIEYKKNKFENFEFDEIIIPISKKNRMLLNWIKFIYEVRKILKKNSSNTFWAADLYSLVIARYIKHKKKTDKEKSQKIIYDSREIYSALSTLANQPFKQKIITRIEKKYIKYISHCVTSGELDSEYLKNFHNLKTPIFVLYNYPNYKKFIKNNIIREKFGINTDKIILVYQGVLLAGRGLVPIMNTIKTSQSDKYVLVILGTGEYEEKLREHAKLLNIEEKVYFSGHIPYEDLHIWTCSADVGLCNIEPISKSYYYALPNKLFEYLQAKLPVLVTNLPALAEIVNFEKCGVVISEENEPNEILSALEEISNNIYNYKNNINKLSRNYSYESQIDLIKQLVV